MPEVPDLDATTAECIAFLSDASHADWSAPVPGMDLGVADVVAHISEVCLWYSTDLAADGRDLQAVRHSVDGGSSPRDLIDTLAACSTVLASVVAASAESARGFHPLGMADPSGFAAMACDELLIHTDDAAQGLGLTFTPPDDLAAAVLARLFPWIDGGDNSWPLLRWANGRTALTDRPRLKRWAWHCAPLAEWDGTVPMP